MCAGDRRPQHDQHVEASSSRRGIFEQLPADVAWRQSLRCDARADHDHRQEGAADALGRQPTRQGFSARTIAPCMPGAAWWVKVTDASTKPAAERPAKYSVFDSAPAMQPTYEPLLARSEADKSSSATTSETPTRPPGTNTRNISASTAGLSIDRFTTQLLITTSTEPSGSGMSSMVPLMNSTLVRAVFAALARANSSISSVISTP